MGPISEAALAHARARLSRMVRPVVLRVQSGSTEMRALAERLADGELLTAEEWSGEGLTLLAGRRSACGHPPAGADDPGLTAVRPGRAPGP